MTELGPLAACTLLQDLDCNDTGVSELGPLAECTVLQNLDCSGTGVTELGPLAACTGMVNLRCPASVTQAQIQLLQEACRNLEEVDTGWAHLELAELC